MKLDKAARGWVLPFVALTLLLAPVARTAVAQEQGSNMQVNVSESGAQISSHIESSGVEKEFAAQMAASNGVRLEVQFESETANRSVELELEATFTKVVEFTDPSGVLNAGSKVLQSIDLSQLSYSPVTSNPTTVGGVQGYQLSMIGTQGGFTFKVVVYAFPSSLSINSTSLSPSALKVLLTLNGYPYVQGNSSLALQVRVDSDRSIDVSEADSQHDIKSADTSLGEQAVFSWSGPLTVDGKSASVKVSTTSQGDEEKNVNLVYPHGNSIVHDPVLGVLLVGAPFYLQAGFLLGVAAVIVVAVVAFVFLRRRRP